MTERKLLLTGFEPWAEHRRNPSKEFIETAPKFTGWAVSSLVLPVDDGCFSLFNEAMRSVDPDAVVSMGLAADRDEISLERCARRGPRSEDGPSQLFSRFLVDGVRQSDDAGTFYCNDIFYLGLRSAEDRKLPLAFVHLPENTDFTSLHDLIERLLRTIPVKG